MKPLPAYGRRETTEDGVRCHVCGRTYTALGVHVVKAHGYPTARAYRQEFGLGFRGLVNENRRSELRRRYKEQLDRVRRIELLVPGKGLTTARSTEARLKNPQNLDRGKAAKALADSNQRRKRRTHCSRGHRYDTENTRIAKDGSRVCRACAREDMRLHRKRRTPSAPSATTHTTTDKAT